nr:hypothetical protein [Tanacetum cinerariifolium]
MLQDVKSYLGRSFAMKDLREAAYILGIKIYRDRTIPMQENMKLSKSQGASTPVEKQRMQNIPYALVVGSIMYGVRCTRPDVAGNMERELRVSCYTDAGYLMNADNLKSQTGYVFVLNRGAVDWKKSISMYCDNTRAIAIAKDDRVTKGARHFRAKVHYLRETIKLGDVKIEKIHTYDNLADPFIKASAFPKHFELTRNIELLPASSFIGRPTAIIGGFPVGSVTGWWFTCPAGGDRRSLRRCLWVARKISNR